MELCRVLTTIDAHTAGEPFRIVTGGLPPIPGDTILARRRWVKEHLDHVRRLLMHEPRGHRDMYGCIVTPPATPGADLGVLFMHNEGYSTACGHGVIALVTVALEQGWLPAAGDRDVVLDVPSGTVRARAEVERSPGGAVRVTRVTFRNVPAFRLSHGLRVELPDGRTVTADVVYGGAFYALVEAARLGLEVVPGQVGTLIDAGMAVKRTVERAIPVEHPLEPELRGVYGTILTGPPRHPDAHQRNVTIFADGQVDRSPCGSGTSATLAALWADGRLRPGEPFVHESILGTLFSARIVEETAVADFPAVVTEVSGSAHVTGLHHFLVDPEDPFPEGFRL